MPSKTHASGGHLRARRWLLLLLCSWTWAHAVRAQGAASPGETPVLRVYGVVVNAVTQAPISRALVTTADQRMALMTDYKGRFEFEIKASASQTSPMRGFPGAGAAYLVAKKPGYLVMGPPFALLLSDQSALKREVRLKLMPESAISGLIATQGADPPSGLTVQLVRKQVQDGEAVWTQAEAQETDARGRYRFGGLMPGDYKVVTAEWVDRIGQFPPPGGKPMLGYPPEAFPNGSSSATAGIIHLGGGQNVEADLNLRSAPYYSVEIPVLGSPGDYVGVNVESENGPGYSLGINRRTQRVEGALPDGVYHITVTESAGQQQGKAPIFFVGSGELTIAGKVVQASPIKLLPGATIPVAVREEFTGPDPDQPVVNAVAVSAGPTAVQAVTLQDPEGNISRPRPVEVFLMSGDRSAGGFGLRNLQLGEPGSEDLVLENVLPGSYRVQMNARRGYVATATAKGVNLLQERLVITAGAASPTISIVLRDDTATITGTVSEVVGKPGGSPGTHAVWAYPLADVESARPVAGFEQPDGKFTLNGVVPGRYLVLASKGETLNLEYRNRDVMKAYESKGVIVTVSSGQTANVELKESVLDDNWPETEFED
jgi:hypothetical protein